MAEERVRASSSSSSLFTLNRPNGLENKTENSSDVTYPSSWGSLLYPKRLGADLHHSPLQTAPMPQTALHLSCPAALCVLSADLQPCPAHTGTCLSRPERPSNPGQLQPLPLQHGGVPADCRQEPLGTRLKGRRGPRPSEELPWAQGRGLTQELTVPLVKYQCGTGSDRHIATNAGAGYLTCPYVSAQQQPQKPGASSQGWWGRESRTNSCKGLPKGCKAVQDTAGPR